MSRPAQPVAFCSDEEEDLESALQKAKTQKDGLSLPPIAGGTSAAPRSDAAAAAAATTDRREREKKAVSQFEPLLVR